MTTNNYGQYPGNIPAQALEWALGQAGPGSRLIRSSLLKGGTSSKVYHMEILGGQGQHYRWVMRLLDDTAWTRREPDLALHEQEALQAARGAGIAAPEWIATDSTGLHCGSPALLMSCLPGQVLLPEQAESIWLQELARELAALHGSTAEVTSFPWKYFTYNPVGQLEIPAWSQAKPAWEIILETVQAPGPDAVLRLIHRDFHPCNVLWTRGAVSGIVDWINACLGPVGIDTAHCRLNLVQLYGVQAADDFMMHYQAFPGACSSAAHPYWDMLSLIELLPGPPGVYKGWEELGFTGLTSELLAARLDEYAEALAAKIRD